jgi:hypothetical protein
VRLSRVIGLRGAFLQNGNPETAVSQCTPQARAYHSSAHDNNVIKVFCHAKLRKIEGCSTMIAPKKAATRSMKIS